ncbi:hypothetical protein E2C01_032926 [Portunus trituberculatus]|uniref:Uncharacterized protein n=1 Tax=Portunus trituberculatus TaxID=210409 RepID=A0A5B7EX72_PORTR|nr:hypothetical protein [Portunus trituberculatus]
MQHSQKHNEHNEDGNSLQELPEDEEALPSQLLPDASYSISTSEESQAAEHVTEEEKESEGSESGDAAKDVMPLKSILKGVTRSPKHPEALKKSVSFSLDNLTSVVKERELYMEFVYHNFCTRLSVLRPSLCPHDETGYVDADREYETEDEDTTDGSSSEDINDYFSPVCEYKSKIRKNKGVNKKIKPKGRKVNRKKARGKIRRGGQPKL